MTEQETAAWVRYCDGHASGFLNGIGSYLVWLDSLPGNALYQADGEWMLLIGGHRFMVAGLLTEYHAELEACTLHNLISFR